MDPKGRQPRFESWWWLFFHYLVRWLWASCLTSLSLGFLICEMRIIPALLHRVVMRIKHLRQPQISASKTTICPTQPIFIFYTTHWAPVGIEFVVSDLNKYLGIISWGLINKTERVQKTLLTSKIILWNTFNYLHQPSLETKLTDCITYFQVLGGSWNWISAQMLPWNKMISLPS